MNKTFKIIQLPQWGRTGLSLTIQIVSVFILLGTFNSFAGNHVPDTQISFGAQQQKRQVSGTVSDVNGEAVIGANVIEKGTTNGTVTDILTFITEAPKYRIIGLIFPAAPKIYNMHSCSVIWIKKVF